MEQTIRSMFTRPLIFSIFLSFGLELINLAVFGFASGRSAFLVDKVIWTLGAGGIGLGAVLGVMIDVMLVGQLRGKEAIWGTSLLAAMTLGFVGKLVTLKMTLLSSALGFAQFPVLYFAVGVVTAGLGGALLGWLLFTDEGNANLEQWGF
jgi:hypothetical protein